MNRRETTVLVVGAGPVGLSASLALSRCGIDNVVVDRRDGPHRAPQAHVVNPRTLEIFRQLGIDSASLRTLAVNREDGGTVRWMTRLDGEELGALPYERQGDENLAFTPTPLLNLSQHLLEPVLLEHSRAEDLGRVRYGHACETLEQNARGVTARIRDLETADTHEIASRYVIAADGASSRIRSGLGIAMLGPDRIQSFAMVHFESDLRSLVRDRPAILYWLLDPDSPGALVAHDIEKTWVLMHPFDPVLEPESRFTATRAAELVRAAIGDTADFTVRGTRVWTMTAQIAERYRAGRVFLAGDSAHRFPPTGGMGMNTGIQDAHNLAWKIAAVEKHRADESLFDSYETERRPVAENNTEQSLANAMKMFDVLAVLGIGPDPEASRIAFRQALADTTTRAALADAIANQQEHFDMFGLQLGFRYRSGALLPDGRDQPQSANPVRDFLPAVRTGLRLPHAFVECAGRRVSTLDLVAYDRITLLCGSAGGSWEHAWKQSAGMPVRTVIEGRDFHDSEGAWSRVREIESDGAILLRPDQHIAWYAPVASIAATGGLCRALAAIAGRTGC